jgi:hypothetical protein
VSTFQEARDPELRKGIGYCKVDGYGEITKDEIDLDAW